MSEGKRHRLSVFPLTGALLFPRAQLPLHLFEPRYRALITDALARDRRIGMVQPREGGDDRRPALYDVGCVGRIAQFEALDDGRFNIVLEGITRFRILSEMDVATPFRQVQASFDDYDDTAEPDPLASVLRADLERESRRFADARGYQLDWDAVARLDDESLVNGIAQIAPFDAVAKQALLEAKTIVDRADLIVQFLLFFRLRDGDDDGATMQ
jgi:Lon protease-like protein